MASISVHRDEPSPANETGLFLCMLEPTEWEGQTTQFSRVCADMNEPLAFLLYGVDGNIRCASECGGEGEMGRNIRCASECGGEGEMGRDATKQDICHLHKSSSIPSTDAIVLLCPLPFCISY
jgi:hypothetical protein